MNDILAQIEEEKKYIEEFPLESEEGTKKMMKKFHIDAINKRNEYVDQKINRYTILKKKIYSELEQRANFLTPDDTSSRYTSLINNIDVYKDVIKYANDFNTNYEKLEFDKMVNNISDLDITNLNRANSIIKRVIDLFKKASINITVDDFNYSMYSKRYMQVYFESMDKDTFKEDILDVFNRIYWECPDLTMHIKLSIRNLYYNYEKELQAYFEGVKQGLYNTHDVDIDNYLDNYNYLNRELLEKQKSDTYLLSRRFLNNELSIYDYLKDSANVRKNLNKFLVDKDFNDLTEDEKVNFFTRIKNLKYVVVELNNYNKYKAMISDIVSRYNKKDTFKGVYQAKLKEMEKLEKERVKLYNKYETKKEKFLFFTKKVNPEIVKIQINEKIKQLNTIFNEIDEAQINDVILNRLDDASTINDALKICSSFYGYFKSLYPKIDGNSAEDFNYIQEYNDLFEYAYGINNTFIRKIKFLENADIVDIIVDKYKLLNINITKEDLTAGITALEESIDFVNLYNNINNSDISLEEIKFLVGFNKINKN